MSACKRCDSTRVVSINAKCDDRCYVDIGRSRHTGYVPRDMGIGGGDYLEIQICLDCGQAKGQWPLPTTELEQACQCCSRNNPGTHVWDGRRACDDCWDELQND